MDLENKRGSVPVYESYKGKQAHGSKSWKTTEKEKRTVTVLGIMFAVLVVLALVSFVLPIRMGIKILLLILAIVFGIGGMGGYLFYVVHRHHKEDPMEMHYYDVDYSRNHITGKGHDNTREISKEEFQGKDRE